MFHEIEGQKKKTIGLQREYETKFEALKTEADFNLSEVEHRAAAF